MRLIDADALRLYLLACHFAKSNWTAQRLCQAVEHAATIDAVPVVDLPHWIPAKDRVPMDDKNVIVCVDGIVTTGYHDERGWFWESDGKAIRRPRVTHWMQLPQAPEGGT